MRQYRIKQTGPYAFTPQIKVLWAWVSFTTYSYDDWDTLACDSEIEAREYINKDIAEKAEDARRKPLYPKFIKYP